MGLLARTLIVGASLALPLTGAMATTISYTTATIAQASTDFSKSLAIQQFDSSLGQLQSVTFQLFGTVTGTIKLGNDSPADSTLTGTLAAMLKLTRPDSTILVTTLPSVVKVFEAAGREEDFTDPEYSGPGGVTYSGLSGSADNSITYTNASDLSLFTGTGTVLAGLLGTASSTASGSGNFSSSFVTKAGGYAIVTYDYVTAAVPEPASWAMMLVGFGAMGGVLRRHRRVAVNFG